MPIKWKSKIILYEIETEYGTDPVPAGNVNAMLMTNVTLVPMEGEDVSRELEFPWIAGQPMIPVGTRVRLRGRVELAPSGTAGVAPAWGPLLRSCRCSQTIVADTSVTYAPISDNMESGTLYFWIGGTRHTAVGCRGDATLRFSAQAIPYIEFDLLGLYAEPTEQTRAVPVLTGFKKPVVVTNANTTFEANATALVLREATLALGNQVEFRGLVGSESIIIPDAAELFSFRVEATPVSTFNPYALAKPDAAALDVELVHGTAAGMIATLAIPAMQLKRPSGFENSQNIAEWPLEGVPQPTTGNDQWSLALT